MNPFSLKVLTDSDQFCNRTREIATLASYAKSNSNVVLFSPRRYGKTSLVHQVQKRLKKNGFITIYVDLFGLSSADTIANRLTKGVYTALYNQKNLLQKAISIIKTHRPVIRPDETGVSITTEPISSGLSGAELLDKTLGDLGHFMAAGKKKINIVLDEFQEITEIRDPDIEGIMRSYIQKHRAGYFFVGSRRRVLLDMFNQRRRPFFQSAINYKLDKLPHDELVVFLMERFGAGHKRCAEKQARKIAEAVDNHPYYSQKLSFFCYEIADRSVKVTDVQQGFEALVQAETPVFEAIVQGLAARQIALLRAIAREPHKAITSMNFVKRHHLKSIGGIQAAVKKLARLDLIEKEGKNHPWQLVDPILAQWLNR
ncbi:MAG: ATP-binding protein [Desulfobacteraceae bacterium]|nr:ATP-binding protein [Desulfobacteraceae bacterium]